MRISETLAGLLLLSLANCGQSSRCHAMPDHSVIACVGDMPVTRSEVLEFLREPQWVPGSAKKQDPRQPAVEKAIKRALLANEANRRALPVASGVPRKPAALSLALLTDEAVKRNITREAVSDEEARRFYDERPDAFGQLDEIKMQAIIVSTPEKAEQVFKAAQNADETRFVQLVEQYSEDAASKANKGELPAIHASRTADRELLTLGLSLRRVGLIGGPVLAADGRYYVVRITEANLTRIPPYNEQSEAKAKNIIVFEKKEALSKELASRLMTQVTVQTFNDAVAALPTSPTPQPSASHP